MKADDERGPKTPRFEFRPGIKGFPSWQGVVRQEGDPSTIPHNAFWDAINVRFFDAYPVSRGGQVKAINSAGSPEPGCIDGIFDFEGVATGVGGGASATVLIGSWPTGSAPNTDRMMAVYAEDAVQPYIPLIPPYSPLQIGFQRVRRGTKVGFQFPDVIATTDPVKCFVKTSTKLYGIGSTEDLGQALFEISLTPASANTRKVLDFPDQISDAVVLQEREGDSLTDVIYFGTRSAGKVYRWSTATGFTTDGTGLDASRMVLGVYHEKIYVTNTQHIYRRDSAGSYTSLTLPAGLPSGGGVTAFKPACTAVFNDILWVGGFDDTLDGGTRQGVLLTTNGSTVSFIHKYDGVGTIPAFVQALKQVGTGLLIGVNGHIIDVWDPIGGFVNLIAALDDEGNDGGLGNPVLELFFENNGRDTLIMGYVGNDSESGPPCLFKSNGLDFTPPLTVVRNRVMADQDGIPLPYGDMVIV